MITLPAQSGSRDSKTPRPLARATATAVVSLALVLTGSPASAVIPAGSSSLAAAEVKLIGEAGGQAGFQVVPAGDLDGDGFQDVIVGAFQEATNGAAAGAAYVVYGPIAPGPIDLGEDADAKLLGELTGTSLRRASPASGTWMATGSTTS